MATSLLALFDDIASILDDVAVLSKVAAKKTTGVLGDDLALNAEQLTGFAAEREIPIVLKVFKGSLINKVILVPVALVISYFAPWLIQPLLMLGGAYLCYEGVEKVYEKLFHKQETKSEYKVLSEDEKIKGAVRTDFVLSAEIIVIALGTVAGASIDKQIMALSIIAILMTVGVYGLVGIIIKLDDFGLYLTKKMNKALKWIGFKILKAAPFLMKTLGVVGTIAMFMVGGQILTHGIHLSNYIKYPELLNIPVDIFVGTLLGSVLVAGHHLIDKLRTKKESSSIT